MREILINTYLDWINNYITIELYAEHNGLTKEQAGILIGVAREVFYSDHPES